MKNRFEHKWRCEQCGALLGVNRAGKLYLKYKAAQFIVEGTVLAVCRRCSHHNQTESSNTTWQQESICVLPHA